MNCIKYKKISRFFKIQNFLFLCTLLDSTLKTKEKFNLVLKNNKIKSIKIKKGFFISLIAQTNNILNFNFNIKGDLILLGFESFTEFLDFYKKKNKISSALKILFSFQHENILSGFILKFLERNSFSFYKNIFLIFKLNKLSLFVLLYLISKLIENKLLIYINN